MSEFKPTHWTRERVKVVAHRTEAGNMIADLPCSNSRCGPCCSPAEFDALFEPIPQRDTVEVSLSELKNLLRCFEDLERPDKPLGYGELKRAVDAREQEQKC